MLQLWIHSRQTYSQSHPYTTFGSHFTFPTSSLTNSDPFSCGRRERGPSQSADVIGTKACILAAVVVFWCDNYIRSLSQGASGRLGPLGSTMFSRYCPFL